MTADETDGPRGVQGSAGRPVLTDVRNVTRLPGQPPPEAHAVALERLLEAMCLVGTINRSAADAYLLAFRIAAVSAPFGDHGVPVAKIIANITKRLESHLAGVPNHQPPGAA